MNSLDLSILIIYIIITLTIGMWVKENHIEGYLANSRSTKFIPLLLSVTASWVGAGAIIGVSAESYRTGISYGLSVILVNSIFMGLFAYFAPKIKAHGDLHSTYTVGEYMGHHYGKGVQFIVSLTYLIACLIWCAIQLLAVAQLCVVIFNTTLVTGLIFSLFVSLIYTLVGGIKSDIVTDVIQFVVMLFGFLATLYILTTGGYTDNIGNLEARYFSPTSFGGVGFLIGSVILGAVYPFINVHEWQKAFAAVDEATARKAYLYSIPLCLLFVSIAILIGLIGASIGLNTQGDQLFFKIIVNYLPSGLKGLVLASLIAVVMSSVDSMLVAGSSCLGRDILPIIFPGYAKKQTVSSYRILAFFFGLSSLLLGAIYSNIVSLSIYAIFLSMAVSPAILMTLKNPKYTSKQILASMNLGFIALISLSSVLGKTVFLAVFFFSMLPLLYKSSAKKPT